MPNVGGRARRASATMALVIGVVVAIAGVGVDAGAASASGSSSSPIVVGGNGSIQLSPGTAQGFEAGIARFNKAGGLDGRKIKFLGYLDDGLSSATNLANIQKLVEDDHVFAVSPVNSQFAGAASGGSLARSHIPAVGWATSAEFGPAGAGTWAIPINGYQVNPSVQGVTDMLQILAARGDSRHPGKMKMALLANSPAGAVAVNNAYAAAAKSLGIDVVYVEAPIAATGTTNYQPYAQTLLGTGANVVYEVLGNTDAVGLAAALKSVGYQGMVVNGVTYSPGQLAGEPAERAALQGVYVATEFPTNDSATPAVKQAKKDLVSIGQPPNLTQGVSQGYWSAIVFEQLLRATLARVGSASKVTPAAVEQTVTQSKGWTYKDPVPGGIGSETFPAAFTYPTSCSTLVKTVGSGYKQVEPYRCTYDYDVTTDQKIDPQTGHPLK